jgi:hypothetical protein
MEHDMRERQISTRYSWSTFSKADAQKNYRLEIFSFRRLRVRLEWRADIHEALLALGCSLVCWNIFKRTEQAF